VSILWILSHSSDRVPAQCKGWLRFAQNPVQEGPVPPDGCKSNTRASLLLNPQASLPSIGKSAGQVISRPPEIETELFCFEACWRAKWGLSPMPYSVVITEK